MNKLPSGNLFDMDEYAKQTFYFTKEYIEENTLIVESLLKDFSTEEVYQIQSLCRDGHSLKSSIMILKLNRTIKEKDSEILELTNKLKDMSVSLNYYMHR